MCSAEYGYNNRDRDDVSSETVVYNQQQPNKANSQSKQQGCKAHRLHLQFRNLIT